jgi:three-Cys-motif partner protein
MGKQVPWDLKLHTAAKHAILEGYLDRWFPILGKHSGRMIYLDGFAGPGRYSNGEKGSPIIALESAIKHIQNGTLSDRVELVCLFIENKAAHAQHLEEELKKLSLPQQIKAHVVQSTFRDATEKLLTKIEAEKKTLAPTFAFVDPFGFSGIPMELMSRLLKNPKCEVFVNIMVEFINRFLDHPDQEITSHFPDTFGTTEVLEIPRQATNRMQSILELYQKQLSNHAKHVWKFDMFGRKDNNLYSLFFATNATKGLEKMKEAMWNVDKYEGHRFSDADPNPANLFEPMKFDPLWDILKTVYAGQTVLMSILEQYIIERTPFLPSHARKIFIEKEPLGEIKAQPLPGKKRASKRDFKSDKIQIVFPSLPPAPQG